MTGRERVLKAVNFNQVHVIQAYVAPELVCAMFDTAFECGRYPIAG